MMAKRTAARRKQAAPDFTPLESEIMGVIWEADPQSVSVREVLECVNAARDKQLAYNTVQTVFHLLRQKEAIQQVASTGRAHRFVANCSRRTAISQMLAELARRVFSGRLQPLIHQLIDDADLSPDELQQLRSWVDAKLKDANSSRPGKRDSSKRRKP